MIAQHLRIGDNPIYSTDKAKNLGFWLDSQTGQFFNYITTGAFMGVPGGGGEGAAAPPPQFVGQAKPVGQYSLHSRAFIIKINGTNSVNFVGNSVNFVGNTLSNRNFSESLLPPSGKFF